MDRMLKGTIKPGKVFDLPLAEVAVGYGAMDERRAIKTLLIVEGSPDAPDARQSAVPPESGSEIRLLASASMGLCGLMAPPGT
jgi:hypothetical protein